MSLFRPAWQTDNEKRALRAIKKETDQTKLLEIARNAPLDSAKVAALWKITDQAVIKGIFNDILITGKIIIG